MTVRPSWPYVDKNHPNESELHVRLKNLAIYWLLQRDFETDDVEHELITERDGTRGSTAQTDVYANNGETEYYIECETDFHHTLNSLSFGGKLPAKEGKNVLVFDTEGIHEVTVNEENVWNFETVSPLPALDLRAFS